MICKIIVSKGPFEAVEAAAYGEKTISWKDTSSKACAACTECFSALDAKSVLEKYKNLDVEVCDITALPEGGDVLIFLGDECAEFAAEKYNLPYEKVTEEDGYRMYGSKTEGKSIVLLYGDGRRGSIYAMDEYLERHGIRFVSPGDEGTFYRESLDISSETEFDIRRKPSYKTRETYSEFMSETSTEFFMWMFHNKMSQFFINEVKEAHIMHKLALNIVGGGHEIWYKYMDINHEYPYKHKLFGGEGKPEDPYEVSPLYKGDVNGDGILTYGEAHPEWYAEVDGVRTLHRDYEMQKRGYWTGDFICTTNEDATDEFSKLMVEALSEGDYRDLSKLKLFALDNGTWCQCEKCRREETYSYKIIMLAYKLNKAIKKATEEGRIKRKITIEIEAYHETLPPPHRPLPEDFDYSSIFIAFYTIERCYVHNLNDPGCTETNKMLYDHLMSWVTGHFKGELILGEYYNVSTFAALPFVFVQRIKNDIPFYYEAGARHFLYLHSMARAWGFQAVNNYLYTRMMWDISADADKIAEEYFIAKYGDDAPKMKLIYKEIEDAGANCKYIKHCQGIMDDGVRKTFALSRCLFEGEQNFFPLKHAKLDYREDDYQAGPSARETMERYEACFNDFKEYIKDKDSAALTEDYEQLEYATYMFSYLYYKAVSMVKEQSSEVLERVEFYQKKLEGITKPLRGYDYGVRYENGFTATGMHEQ